jgi:hypothetical protein
MTQGIRQARSPDGHCKKHEALLFRGDEDRAAGNGPSSIANTRLSRGQ